MSDIRKLITTIFTNFTVDQTVIPVSFMRYKGNGTTYVTWMQYDMDNSYAGDNELLGYVGYYDFDVYSKDDYTNIIEAIKNTMKDNGFMFQPSRCSPDMFEDETGYYHKTISFAIEEAN